MRPPSEASAQRSGPPPRRAAGSPPPRRPPGPGPRPAPRPAPARAPGPPRGRTRARTSHPGRRRSIFLAAALTALILVGYGGYTAWNAITATNAPAPVDTGNGFVASADRAALTGQLAVGMGVNLRILKDGNNFLIGMNQSIDQLRVERANLERLATRASGARADILASSVQATVAMETGMVQWRDGIVNLRLGSIAAAESTIETAVAQLQSDVGRWKAQTG